MPTAVVGHDRAGLITVRHAPRRALVTRLSGVQWRQSRQNKGMNFRIAPRVPASASENSVMRRSRVRPAGGGGGAGQTLTFGYSA